MADNQKTEQELFDEAWNDENENQSVDQNNAESETTTCSECGGQLQTDESGTQYCPNCDGEFEEGEEPESDENQSGEAELEGDNQDSESGQDSEDNIDWKEEAEKWKQKYKSWEGRYKREKEQQEEKIKTLEQEVERLKNASESKRNQGQQGSSEQTGTDDEDLKQFAEEFPDLHGPINRLIERKAQELMDSRLGEVKQEFEPIKNQVQSQAREEHTRRIKQAHPDVDEIVQNGDLEQWIEEQPSWMRDRANQIKESGSTEEVIELLDTYKKSKEKVRKNQDAVKRKKAKEASAVRRHSPKPVSKQTDPDDFDAGWEEALQEG